MLVDLLGHLHRGKHQAATLELEVPGEWCKRRGLTQPHRARGKEDILPQLGERAPRPEIGRIHRDHGELQPVRAQALRLRCGRGPARVAGAGRQVGPGKLAHGAEQRHAQLAVRGKLVLEESGREQGEAARAVGHGDEPLRRRGGHRSLAGVAPCLRGDGRTDHAAELAAGHGRDPRHTGRHAEPEPVIDCAVVEVERAAERRAGMARERLLRWVWQPIWRSCQFGGHERTQRWARSDNKSFLITTVSLGQQSFCSES